ncbi:MAG: ABC transporter permease [Firmicutes bacterium]|nr:ABC transporter permease [Bacillota bacterium]
MRHVVGILYLQTKVAFRNWWLYTVISLIPASYYIVFYLLGGSNLSDNVLVGFLVALSSNVGVVSLPQFVVLDKARKLQEMMVASPVTPFSYMLGFALARLVFAIPGLGVVLGLLLSLGRISWENIPVIVIVMLVIWLVGSMIGFTIGMYVSNITVVSSVSNLVGYMLMLIPPVLYPASLLSDTWRPIALLFPTSSAAYLMRSAISLEAATKGEIVLTVSVIFTYLIGCGLLVIAKSHWRES